MEEQHSRRQEETRTYISIVLIYQEQSCTSELFKVIQDAVSLNPSLQDNVIIPDGFFKYIYHVGCAINLHSIINSGLIPGGQNLSNRQTVFFLLVDPMDKNHNDPVNIDLEAPRLAQYMHKAWKKHQKYGVLGRHQCCFEERMEVLSDSIERDHSSRNASSLLYSESCSNGNWRSHVRESIHASPRPPPKISLKHDWMKELGSEVVRQPEGEVAQQSKSSQSSQPNPNPDHDRTGRPVVCPQRGALRSQEIETHSIS